MPDEARNGADQRPSPEALLAEAGQEGRGQLKIFLGAAPGVGKTYEMLTSARRRKLDGVDVVVGLVETHGRRETAALLAGLEIVPRRRVPHRGRELEEMDLDRLLKRRPQLALVDELAHDNAPGSRHPKRWMDVEELLAAGIDVWTTVNVQHVESLNDVVAQITHVRVRETVPDSVLDQAEIELIDLTPDELRERLHEGKVYVPEAAGRALDHYFSHGNLTALRELALRRTAERVDDQMVQYMRAHGLAGPWAAGERLLACVHGGEGAAELIRYTKRLADRLRAPWTAIHVQTAADRRAGEAANDRVADTLRLAERLGGETLVLPGERIAEEILAWARGNNVTQIVIGSVRRSGWRDWFRGSLPRDLIRGADDIVVLVLPEGGETAPPKRVRARVPERRPQLLPYLGAAAMVAAATGAGWLLQNLLDLSNVALIFVVPVLAAALAWGLGPGLAAAVLAVLGYNFFFLDPLYTFHISDPENVAGLLLFSAVAVLASSIASRTRSQTLVARQEAARAAALYAFAKKLTGVAGIDDLLWAAAHQVAMMLKAEVVFLLPEDGSLAVLAAYPPEDQLDANDLAAAEWCWRNDTPAGRGSDNLPGAPRLFLPLRTGRGKLGVAGIKKDLAGPLLTPAERRLLDALLDQTALAIDRVQLARDVDATKLLAETERLRTALLTSIGHDLKTPLASILGAISALRSYGASYGEAAREDLLATAQEEAERLARFVDNLLDMTRLEAGALGPKREPVDVADAVGSALRRTSRLLAGHRVETDLPANLPLLRADFVLLEQVLVNLLENAARYAPAGTPVEIAARIGDEAFLLEVRDRGPGIPPDEAGRIFDRFYRALNAVPGKGVGLGLAVAKGFVEAMGGTIAAHERQGGGAVFRLSFPAELVTAARARRRPLPHSPATVLVVDDEPAIRRFLKSTLEHQGWAMVEAVDADEATRAVRHHRPEIILLDLGLPDRDGMALLPELKRLSDAAILVLTSRDDERSKVAALDAGADDYVTKPFSIPELLARMRTALRHRVQEQGGRPAVQAGELTIDLVHRRVARAGEEIKLSPKEWDILEQLALHAGRVVTHGQILAKVWGRATETEQQYLRVYLRQLRQKLEPEPDRPRWLVTEAGVGYRLMAEG